MNRTQSLLEHTGVRGKDSSIFYLDASAKDAFNPFNYEVITTNSEKSKIFQHISVSSQTNVKSWAYLRGEAPVRIGYVGIFLLTFKFIDSKLQFVIYIHYIISTKSENRLMYLRIFIIFPP